MPEQNSQNAKTFDPASFSMPPGPSLNYKVIANTSEPELSSYVQTVFHRPMGAITAGARLSDQPLSESGPAQANVTAAQPPVPHANNGVSNYQRQSIKFNLSDQTAEAPSYRPSQQQSFAPPADHSNLPYIPRTDVSRARRADSSARVPDVTNRKVNETEDQNFVAKKTQVPINKTKLVDLREGSPQKETPQRDQNTIAQKPQEFLKRVAFSNKFKVTPSGDREVGNEKSTGKIIYLKSKSTVEHTAKLKVPNLVQEKDPQPLAKPTVTRAEPAPASVEPIVPQPPKPQIIQWPIVDSAQEQVLFPAPVVKATPLPKEIDFVSASPTHESETTKIDFAEVNQKVFAEPENEMSTDSAFNPFETAEAPGALVEPSPLQATQEQTSPVKSSPFESAPEQASPFEAATEEVSPFDSAPEQASPFDSVNEQSSPFESAPEESSPFESSPFESSPFETAPKESSPFQSPPEEPSPFRSTLFQSSPNSSFETENAAEPAQDFSVPSPPVTSVSFTGNKQEDATDVAAGQSKKDTGFEASPVESDVSSCDTAAPLKSKDNPFQVIAHRKPELISPSAPAPSKFENADFQAAKKQDATVNLPEFKPGLSAETASQHFTATTLQSGYRTETQTDQQFETPWLSPWWMLIGLIPIALYMGTMKLFKDEDEYHSHKTELFGSHLEFRSDFGEMGRSKSDDVYGRQDEAPIVRGPSGETVALDADPVPSTIAFAESLEFGLPSATEVADPSFGQELRIDQSPNFSEAGKTSLAQPSSGGKKKRQGNSGKKRSKR